MTNEDGSITVPYYVFNDLLVGLKTAIKIIGHPDDSMMQVLETIAAEAEKYDPASMQDDFPPPRSGEPRV